MRVTTIDFGYDKDATSLLSKLRLLKGDLKTQVVYGKDKEIDSPTTRQAVICIRRHYQEYYGFVNVYF